MAEKRLIDANALRAVLKNEECNCEVFPWAVDNAPTVDAVEVVRCKRCLFGIPVDDPDIPDCYACTEDAEFEGGTMVWHGFVAYHSGDFYCAYGERDDDA